MRRRRKKNRDRAADGIECGCCLADVLATTALITTAIVWRRARRTR